MRHSDIKLTMQTYTHPRRLVESRVGQPVLLLRGQGLPGFDHEAVGVMVTRTFGPS
jgi:hypothetical protein